MSNDAAAKDRSTHHAGGRLSPAFARTVLKALWRLSVILTALVFVYPEKDTAIRACTLAGFAAIWIGTLLLYWRKAAVRVAAAAVAVIIVFIAVVPGRHVPASVMRIEYTRRLVAYDGAKYLWGGESPLGIDCSGLIRRGMIDAYLNIGVRTANPAALRDAFSLWWHDTTADDMGMGYSGRTRLVADVRSLNTVPLTLLVPGDIAVTGGGAHVLAYLGNATWIDADPKPWHVEEVHVPAPRNGWFVQSARIMRWRALEEAT